MLNLQPFNTIGKAIWDRRGLWSVLILIWVFDFWLSPNLARADAVFLLIGICLFILPHLVPDLHLPAWILIPHWEKRPTYWAVILLVHLIAATCMLGIWRLSPDFFLALLTALVIWHWGSMDTFYLYRNARPSWLIGSIGRGMLVVLAPVFFQPLEVQNFVLNLFGLSHSNILMGLYAFALPLLVVAVVLELMALLVSRFIEGHRSPADLLGHLLESGVLLLLFAWVTPVIGLTFYYLILHSSRHLQRLTIFMPAKRGKVTKVVYPIQNLLDLFQKTKTLVFISLILMAFWLGMQLYQGSSFDQAVMNCLIPPGLFLATHSLTTLLTEFNRGRFED